MINSRNVFIFVLISLAAIARVTGVLPYNFSPVAAIALFGSAMFSNRILGFVVPVAIMLLSDAFIGFHDTMWAVYLGFLSIAMVGQLLRRNPSMLNAFGGAILGSVLFFVLTNAACWLTMPEYSKDLSGLMNSFAAGLPFFRGTLLGDIIFTTVFFGSYKLAEYRFPTLAKA